MVANVSIQIPFGLIYPMLMGLRFGMGLHRFPFLLVRKKVEWTKHEKVLAMGRLYSVLDNGFRNRLLAACYSWRMN